MNRKSRRAQGSKTKRAVKGIAKAVGQAEPTADEKDPAFLAMQVRSLQESLKQIIEVNGVNWEGVQKAFAMVDVHQQVLHRITREVVLSLEASVSLIKRNTDGTLDMHAYYEEYRDVGQKAGPELADLAVVLWSQGYSPEDAIARASVERDKRAEQPELEAQDPDYEVHHFGGDYGQNHHEQDPTSAQADG